MISISVKQNIISFIVGLTFSIGLALSGMTQPQKVIQFLNPWDWDPSLIFVMLGAIGVHMLSYRLMKHRSTPLLDTKWHIPTRKDLTPRLFIGSAVFGTGWGLAGFCPGPALATVGAGEERAILFFICLIVGMILFKMTEPFLKLKQ